MASALTPDLAPERGVGGGPVVAGVALLATATAIYSASRRPAAHRRPWAARRPQAAGAAGEWATARNMFGVAPKARWMSANRARRSGVNCAGGRSGQGGTAAHGDCGDGRFARCRTTRPTACMVPRRLWMMGRMKSSKVVPSSALAESRQRCRPPVGPAAAFPRARLAVHSGPLCGVTTFESRPGRAFLHVLPRCDGAATTGSARTRGGCAWTNRPCCCIAAAAAASSVRRSRLGPHLRGTGFRRRRTQSHRRRPARLVRVPLAGWTVCNRRWPCVRRNRPPALRLAPARRPFVRGGADQLLRWIIDHPTGGHRRRTHRRPRRCAPRPRPHGLPARPQEEWSLARMAATAGMSRSALRGSLPDHRRHAAYLADWRASLATSLLRGTAAPTHRGGTGLRRRTIAVQAFRQRLGQSPRSGARAGAAGEAEHVKRPAQAAGEGAIRCALARRHRGPTRGHRGDGWRARAPVARMASHGGSMKARRPERRQPGRPAVGGVCVAARGSGAEEVQRPAPRRCGAGWPW